MVSSPAGRRDVIVVGGGISGLSFAAQAARAGRSVLLLDAAERLGGCLHTAHAADDFWLELGGHTAYNSYGSFLDLLEGVGLLGELAARGKPVLRFLDGDRLLPGANLGGLLRRMRLLPLAAGIVRGFFSSPAGKTVRDYYGRFVGATNYERVLGPMLSAVPSQRADDFPADMLFKKRPRRKDVRRSFTLRGGLGSVAGAVAALPGLEAVTGQAVASLERDGDGWAVVTGDGTRERAAAVALAVPPGTAARLLAGVAPGAAAAAGAVAEVSVDSVGVAVESARVALPYATFLIPTGDLFRSVVTRDVVAHPSYRGFTFHFGAGVSEADRLARITAVLGVPSADLGALFQRRTTLPSPVLGHAATVAALDRAVAGLPLAVTGNWMTGLSIEDCVSRSVAEWRRISALTGGSRQ